MALEVPARSTRRSAMMAAAAAMILGAFVAVAFDFWYRDLLISRERERVLALITPYASAVESSVGRRVSRLSGLRAFVETRRSRQELDEEFPSYAEGLRTGVTGIRALELVHRGRVTTVVPREGNEVVAGYNLFTDSRPSISSDVRRALASGGITVSGPLQLLQGGQGMVVRQLIKRTDTAFPDLVAMVLDLPPLLAEAHSFAPTTGIRFVLRDREGRMLEANDSLLVDGVRVSVRLVDGPWSVDAAPTRGWHAAVLPNLRPTRIASALIVLLLTWATYLFVGRQTRLADLVDARTAALRDANGVLTREVGERHDAELRLREKEERLRLALDAGRMGPWEFDPLNDRFTWSESALAIMGRDASFAHESAESFFGALTAESREAVRGAVRQAMADRQGHVEYRWISPDGTERWLYGVGEVQRDESGAPVQLIGILADVTDRRQLEEQLLHSQKMEAVGTLAGGIAHDFNNLLTAILGFTQLAQQQASTLRGTDDQKSLAAGVDELNVDLDEVQKAGERAAMLTAQLLAFSRRQVVNPKQMDVNVVVRDVERMLRRLIGERLTLETTLSAARLPVRADQGQVAQVIVNLVVNARDAMPAGGTIRIGTDRMALTEIADAPLAGLQPGEWVVFTVADDGVGMSPEVLTRAFEPFFTTKPVGEGTGLGLSTVYGIVTQAGGRVFVESEPGEGTTVRVALPCMVEEDRPARHTPTSVPVVTRGERVLVVEDEGGLRRLISEVLTRRGYMVTVANDGNYALQALDADPDGFDLVLTDMVMPGLDGPTLAMQVRQRGLQLPILFMSGYPSVDPSPDGEEFPFIAKPFTPTSLAEAVHEEIERARRAQVPTGNNTLP